MPLEVLVTGAGRGLGLELARQLSSRGDRVVGTYRDPDCVGTLQGMGVQALPLDVTHPNSVARLARAFADRPLDVLVNNAGVGVRGRPFGSIDYEEILRFVDTNACGPLRMVEALLPSLLLGHRRLVVNITSKMGSIADNGSGDAYAYRASKVALNMVTRSLAIDLAPQGVTCMLLHPGWVRTDMGGASAPTSVQDSVAGLIARIDEARIEHSGRFFDTEGQEIPW